MTVLPDQKATWPATKIFAKVWNHANPHHQDRFLQPAAPGVAFRNTHDAHCNHHEPETRFPLKPCGMLHCPPRSRPCCCTMHHERFDKAGGHATKHL